MNRNNYSIIENYMKECMKDTVHDELHVYRVVNYAAQIASKIVSADFEVVIVSAMLHDIGRIEEQNNPLLNHAEVGSKKAYKFLINNGYTEEFAEKVAKCILTHRHKNSIVPETIEEKIVYDADKLDLIGSVGCARAILFGGQIAEPLYILAKDNFPTKGEINEEPSLIREYHRKLCNLSCKLHTEEAKTIAKIQQQNMNNYFESLIEEINNNYKLGRKIIEDYFNKI